MHLGRTVSLSAYLKLLLDSFRLRLAWIFLLAWACFGFLLTDYTDAFSPKLDAANSRQAKGILRAAQITSHSEGVNGQTFHIWRYEFQYNDELGRSYMGVSYGYEQPQFTVGDTIELFYLKADPAISQMKGMRQKPIRAIFFWVGTAPFLAIGLILMGLGLMEGARKLHLLRYGKLVEATLIGKKAVLTGRTGLKSIYRIDFAVETGGDKRALKLYSRQNRLNVGDAARLLYDDTHNRAILLDDYPKLRFDHRHDLIDYPMSSVWVDLLIPMLFVLFLLLWVDKLF